MRKLRPNLINISNANRRLRAKKYLAGKKKNIFGIMKNKKDVVNARGQLARGKEAVKAVFSREHLIKSSKQLREGRAKVKKKGAARKAQKKVLKQMGMGYGVYA